MGWFMEYKVIYTSDNVFKEKKKGLLMTRTNLCSTTNEQSSIKIMKIAFPRSKFSKETLEDYPTTV